MEADLAEVESMIQPNYSFRLVWRLRPVLSQQTKHVAWVVYSNYYNKRLHEQ